LSSPNNNIKSIIKNEATPKSPGLNKVKFLRDDSLDRANSNKNVSLAGMIQKELLMSIKTKF